MAQANSHAKKKWFRTLNHKAGGGLLHANGNILPLDEYHGAFGVGFGGEESEGGRGEGVLEDACDDVMMIVLLALLWLCD